MKKFSLLVLVATAAVSFANPVQPPKTNLGDAVKPPKQNFVKQMNGSGTLLELPDDKNRIGGGGDPVPEPATMAALAIGAGALMARRRKKA